MNDEIKNNSDKMAEELLSVIGKSLKQNNSYDYKLLISALPSLNRVMAVVIAAIVDSSNVDVDTLLSKVSSELAGRVKAILNPNTTIN
jgi:flagellar biosynthesis/type III secretory pathway M-ring protein FliF/YscJ